MTLSIEEDILLSAGLLTPNYNPESELDEGEEHLFERARRAALRRGDEPVQFGLRQKPGRELAVVPADTSDRDSQPGD